MFLVNLHTQKKIWYGKKILRRFQLYLRWLRTTHSGFTLIELLVVIAVIGVLAGAVVVIVNPAAQLARARDAQRKQDLRAISQALELYALDNGEYPVTGNVTTWRYSTAGDTWIPGLAPYYLKRVPKDPKNNAIGPWGENQNYSYAYGSNGLHYNLVAKLENATDPERCQIKRWFFISSNNGNGNPWCPPSPGYNYSPRVYSRNDKGT